MEQIKIRFIGESPLLMHNNRLANPLGKYSQAISQKSGKRKKTIDDIWELARIEWEGGLYLNDGEVALPVRVINKTMERGATKQKNGTLWKTGCTILDDFCLLDYKGTHIKVVENGDVPNPELDKFFEIYLNQMVVRVGQASILRSRPVFTDWSCEAEILFDTTIMNGQSLIQAAEDAGRLVGFCDYRVEKGGNFGRFKVEVV